MNLEEFAKKAGVIITECDKSWGGTVAYKLNDHPNCTYAGFKTVERAYKHWIENSFGKTASKAILSLLETK